MIFNILTADRETTMNTNIYEYLDDLQLGIGESKRLNCPFCNSYKTFTVTNNMGKLLWNCYKSSCKLSGAKKIRISANDIKNKFMSQKEQENNTFTLPEYVILDNDRWEVLCFAVKYGIDNVSLCLHYDVKEKRVVFPVYIGGLMVDAVGRSITNRLPKWKRYGKSDLPFTYGCGKVAVVVEDCVSASVVGNEVYVGVAVLGTSLSESHKRYLSQFSTAIVALDPDALPKTLLFAKEIRDVVPNVKVLKLTDDLKYRKEEDFNNLYNLTPKE
jgi:hypothetical protein